MDVVSALSSDRLSVLEQALPLAEHFVETHNGLASWLDDIEAQVNMLALPALRPDKIVQQQDRNEVKYSCYISMLEILTKSSISNYSYSELNIFGRCSSSGSRIRSLLWTS